MFEVLDLQALEIENDNDDQHDDDAPRSITVQPRSTITLSTICR